MPFDLTDRQWLALLRGMVRAEYHLLFGAGASMDSTSAQGRLLPSADQLVRDLVSEFAIPADPYGLSLGRAFEAARTRRGRDGSTLPEYLRRTFSDCSPAAWYDQVATTRWEALWTLNIDDVVQRAFERVGAAAEQSLVTLSWSDRFQRPEPSRNEVQLVHLHGSVLRVKDDVADIVFSIVEYLRAAEHRHAWHHIFSDEFQAKPFVVIGARLCDEVDLAEILRRGNHAYELTGRPSVVVLREIDALQREEFTSWGLHPIEATGKDFFERLSVDMRTHEAEFAARTPGGRTRLVPEAARFLKQFRRLRVDHRLPVTSGHDLYAGHEPEWPDIVADRDALFSTSRKLSLGIRKTLDAEPTQTIAGIFGPPFSGKSVVLLRVAREILRGPEDVYLFSGDEKLDVDAVHWWLQQDDKVVLLFDGAADQIIEIARLADLCSATGTRFTAVIAERNNRALRIYAEVPPEMLNEHVTVRLGSLSDSDIRSLTSKLRDARRLGLISGLSHRKQEDYFRKESGRQLVEGMARLESGQGFIDRLTVQYGDVSDPALKSAYGMVCVASAFGYALPVPILSAASGVGTGALIAACRDGKPLSEVLQVVEGKVRPRHRRLASLVVESVIEHAARYDLTQSLARNLAPYVTRSAIRQRTIAYRIARELMSARILQDWLGSGNVEAWYSELVDVYDWNARYWEQRAIASAHVGRFDRAESYAAHAVDLHRDAFTLTTLGNILMRKAIQWVDAGTETSWEYFRRGDVALREAARRGDGRAELPYLAYFQNALDMASAVAGPPNEELVSGWNHWSYEARSVRLFAHSSFAEQLAEFQRKWLQLAAVAPAARPA